MHRSIISAYSESRSKSRPIPYGPRTKVEETLIAIWKGILGLRDVYVNDDFFEVGGNSLMAVRLVTKIRETVGKQISVADVIQKPTIEQMALILEQRGEIWSPLITIQPLGSKFPFFCVHGLGGGVWGYGPLASFLDQDRPFYGFQARGMDGKEEPDSRIEDMSARNVAALKQIYPRGPIYLGGYSYGGYVAFEMAQQLTQQGRAVAALVMLDTYAPHYEYKRPELSARSVLRFLQNFPHWAKDFSRLHPKVKIARIQRHLRLLSSLRWLKQRSAELNDFDLRDLFDGVDQLPEVVRRKMELEMIALQTYEVKPYPGRVTLLRARTQPLVCSHDPFMGWKELAGEGVAILPCPGSHHTLLREPYVLGLASQLGDYLNREDQKWHRLPGH